MPAARVEAAWGIGPHTRPGIDDWVRIDSLSIADEDVVRLVRAWTRRGLDVRSGVSEPSEHELVVNDPDGTLDRRNTASPWFPNVRRRTRIRVVLEPEGEDEIVLLTGFLDRAKPWWLLGAAVTTLSLTGLLAVTGGIRLEQTVYDHTVREWGAWAHWPMAESEGHTVEDVIGGHDGTYLRAASESAGQAAIAYDDRPVHTVGWSGADLLQRAEFAAPPASNDWSFTLAFDLAIPHLTPQFAHAFDSHQVQIWQLGPDGDSPGATPAGNPGKAAVWADWGGNGSRGVWFMARWGGASFRAVSFSMPMDVFDDGATHHVVVRLNPFASRASSGIWVDGVKWSGPVGVGLDQAIVGPFAGRPHSTGIARHFSFTNVAWTTPADRVEVRIARMAYFPSALADFVVQTLWEARNAPWAGDTTGQRLARIYEIAGVDPADTDIDLGVATCGPAILQGKTVAELAAKTVQTEAGAIIDTPDGKIRFRARPPNDPTPVVTWAGNSDDGIPYIDVDVDDGAARLVNVATASREGGLDQVVRNEASIFENGEMPATFETVAASTGGARAVAQRAVFRYGSDQTVYPAVTVNGRADEISCADLLDPELGDAGVVMVAPPHGTDSQVSTIEAIEHTFSWSDDTIESVYGTRETVTFPIAQADVAGRGADVAVTT